MKRITKFTIKNAEKHCYWNDILNPRANVRKGGYPSQPDGLKNV